MNIGEKIKELRIKKGLTLEQLGEKVGVGKSTVRKWETGFIENMRRDKVEKLAIALDVPVDFFFDYDDDVPVYDGPRSSLEEDFGDLVKFSPAQKKLFQTLKGASEEEIEQATKIIEALRK